MEKEMLSLENELTRKNVELTRNHSEFQKRHELEKTYILLKTDFVEKYRQSAVPCESVYLSHPDEEFSLRVQAKYLPEGTVYTTTVKDRGEMNQGMLDRLELEAEISEETFNYYKNDGQFPSVKFLRSEAWPGLAIDFIEGTPYVQVEYEHDPTDPKVAPLFRLIENDLVDMSDDPSVRKEHIAHRLYGKETLRPPEQSLDTFADRIFRDMVAQYVMGRKQVVVGIGGMSGSGKSSVVRKVQDMLTSSFGEEFQPITLSTDDYHRGKKWLEEHVASPWINWEKSIVYDTAALRNDLERLAANKSILRRHFDFDAEEIVWDEVVESAPFVVVEGLYAGSEDLDSVRHLFYEVPTNIATCVGRDGRRLILEDRANGAFSTPEERIAYDVTYGIPTYLEAKRELRNTYSASSRPLAERAFMLGALTR